MSMQALVMTFLEDCQRTKVGRILSRATIRGQLVKTQSSEKRGEVYRCRW